MRMTGQTLLETLQASLNDFRGRIVQQPTLAQAGVLVAITEESDPKIVLTRRAKHLSTHSGEVAFAGGKQDDTDRDIVHTALREAHEEIHLPEENVKVLGQLDQVVSRFGYVVTPVVGLVSAHQEFVPNPDELDAVFKVPVSYFLNNDPDEYFVMGKTEIPTYHYEGFHIWGLTSMMIVEMLNRHFDADIHILSVGIP